MSVFMWFLVCVFALVRGQHVTYRPEPIEVQEGNNFTVQWDTNMQSNLENYTVDCLKWEPHLKPLIYMCRNGVEQFTNGTILNFNDLRRGVVTLTFIRASQSNSTQYRIRVPRLNLQFFFNVTVTSRTSQQNRTEMDKAEMTTPAADRTTHADGTNSTTAAPRIHIAVLPSFIFIISLVLGAFIWKIRIQRTQEIQRENNQVIEEEEAAAVVLDVAATDPTETPSERGF